MPMTRRRISHPIAAVITPGAMRAWQEGDCPALRRALQIRPWQTLPWPTRMTTLGVDPRRPPDPDDSTPWAQSWQRAVELQLALTEAAGPPPKRLKD